MIRYALIVQNLGSMTASNITVQDPVPANLTFHQGLTDAPCALQGNTVVCPGITLAPGEQKMMMVAFTVTAVCGSTIQNTATVTTPGDPNPENDSSGPKSTLVTCP